MFATSTVTCRRSRSAANIGRRSSWRRQSGIRSTPFDHFVFVEMDAMRCGALADIQTENRNIDIKIIRAEDDEVLRNLVHQKPWVQKND